MIYACITIALLYYENISYLGGGGYYLLAPYDFFIVHIYVYNKVRGATLAEYAPHSPTKYQNT